MEIGILILGIIWIILSPAWFWADNTTMGIIWLYAGVAEVIIAFTREEAIEELRTKHEVYGWFECEVSETIEESFFNRKEI